jgi:meiotically up-regulated gene 157 (Mug157) protein
MKRRKFIRNNGIMIGAAVLGPAYSFALGNAQKNATFISNRPPLNKRTFTSDSVERLLEKVKSAMMDQELSWMFENCYPNTLDTTVDHEIIDGKPDTFIITGDIDAMWLRDSTAQVWPYMPLISEDESLKILIKGLINRQVKCVLKDPYANAFYKDLERESHWKDDQPSPIPGVHERKWEIDSLCYTIRLSNEYYRITRDTSIFDDDWQKAMKSIIAVFRQEQRKDGDSPYHFSRKTTAMIDAPTFSGTGRPIKPVGLIASMFRPSDDASLYPFLIPSNIFAVLSLRQLGIIYKNEILDYEFSKSCFAFANEVEAAINQYAIADHLDFGPVYAYEVDGFGNKLFMDDANVPSLMSLAYLERGFSKDPIYSNTRKFLLSDSNPYYLKGSAAEGQASPHTGKEKIWPMGIILRAMTSKDTAEISHCLKMLKETHAGTGFMHEAFHKDDPNDYNRSWFAWANTLFGELIIKIYYEHPELLRKEI